MTPRQIIARLRLSERVRRSRLADVYAVVRTAMHGEKKDCEALIKELTR